MTGKPETSVTNAVVDHVRAPAEIREVVEAHYAEAITRVRTVNGCGCDCSAPDEETFASAKYDDEFRGDVDPELVQASFGCGNPLVVADLRPGDRVLDLGSGGGLDVLLSARRVGPTGKAYGLDMTDEMLAAARQNAEKAGATNVEFVKGHIESIPLPDASIDVVISNCVINLSPNKPAVFAEIMRVLTPGGRVGVSDIVCEDDITVEERAKIGSWAECAAGALTRSEYIEGLMAAGFIDVDVVITDTFPNKANAAIVRAVKGTFPS